MHSFHGAMPMARARTCAASAGPEGRQAWQGEVKSTPISIELPWAALIADRG
ncbi:MAG TPA: hypothetical protein VNM90_00265 [Haliangium sp.]|nr:hypothetical protein [Haliangium sp.]